MGVASCTPSRATPTMSTPGQRPGRPARGFRLRRRNAQGGGDQERHSDRNVVVRLFRFVLRCATGLDSSSARPFVAPISPSSALYEFSRWMRPDGRQNACAARGEPFPGSLRETVLKSIAARRLRADGSAATCQQRGQHHTRIATRLYSRDARNTGKADAEKREQVVVV